MPAISLRASVDRCRRGPTEAPRPGSRSSPAPRRNLRPGARERVARDPGRRREGPSASSQGAYLDRDVGGRAEEPAATSAPARRRARGAQRRSVRVFRFEGASNGVEAAAAANARTRRRRSRPGRCCRNACTVCETNRSTSKPTRRASRTSNVNVSGRSSTIKAMYLALLAACSRRGRRPRSLDLAHPLEKLPLANPNERAPERRRRLDGPEAVQRHGGAGIARIRRAEDRLRAVLDEEQLAAHELGDICKVEPSTEEVGHQDDPGTRARAPSSTSSRGAIVPASTSTGTARSRPRRHAERPGA